MLSLWTTQETAGCWKSKLVARLSTLRSWSIWRSLLIQNSDSITKWGTQRAGSWNPLQMSRSLPKHSWRQRISLRKPVRLKKRKKNDVSSFHSLISRHLFRDASVFHVFHETCGQRREPTKTRELASTFVDSICTNASRNENYEVNSKNRKYNLVNIFKNQ